MRLHYSSALFVLASLVAPEVAGSTADRANHAWLDVFLPLWNGTRSLDQNFRPSLLTDSHAGPGDLHARLLREKKLYPPDKRTESYLTDSFIRSGILKNRRSRWKVDCTDSLCEIAYLFKEKDGNLLKEKERAFNDTLQATSSRLKGKFSIASGRSKSPESQLFIISYIEFPA